MKVSAVVRSSVDEQMWKHLQPLTHKTNQITSWFIYFKCPSGEEPIEKVWKGNGSSKTLRNQKYLELFWPLIL